MTDSGSWLETLLRVLAGVGEAVMSEELDFVVIDVVLCFLFFFFSFSFLFIVKSVILGKDFFFYCC